MKRLIHLGLAAAVALVATAAAVAATPQAAIAANDLIVVTDISPTNSVHTKGKSVQCPSGTKVLGGGGTVINGSDRVHLHVLYADDGLNGFRAGAAEIRPGDYTPGWRIRVYAICGPDRLNVLYFSDTTVESNKRYKQAQYTCPRGTRLVSAGGTVNQQQNYVALDDVEMLSDLRTANVWAIARESGAPHDWDVTAHAVCVSEWQLSGLERIELSSPANHLTKDLSLTCPSGKQLYGVGAALASSGGHALHQTLAPVDQDPPITATTLVKEDPTGSPKAWSVRLQAMCAY